MNCCDTCSLDMRIACGIEPQMSIATLRPYIIVVIGDVCSSEITLNFANATSFNSLLIDVCSTLESIFSFLF